MICKKENDKDKVKTEGIKNEDNGKTAICKKENDKDKLKLRTLGVRIMERLQYVKRKMRKMIRTKLKLRTLKVRIMERLIYVK